MDANPFADPSIRQAVGPTSDTTETGNTGTATGGSGGGGGGGGGGTGDTYNPFGTSGNGYGATSTHTTQPATGGQQTVAAADRPPAFDGSMPQVTADFERKQAELDKRAEALERREEELRRQQVSQGASANNWPPLPSFFPLKPCFFHDINLEIPQAFQLTVRMLYFSWFVHAVLYLLNFLASMAYMFANSEAATSFGVSILHLVIIAPCSFLCWYRPVYKAFRSDSSFNFMFFFFWFFIQTIVDILAALGFVNLGFSGWISAFSSRSAGSPFVEAVMFICAIIFTILAASDVFLLIRVHALYRNTNASFEKAQQEFREGAFRNEFVRDAGAAAIRSAASGAVAGSTGNRY